MHKGASVYLEVRKRNGKRGDVAYTLELAVRRSVRRPGHPTPSKETVLQLPRVRFYTQGRGKAYPRIQDRVMAWYVLADWVRGEMGGREILTPEYRNYAQDRKRWERHPSGPAPESPEFPHVADDVRAEFGAVIRGLAQRIGRPSRAEVDLVYGKDESGNIGRASWERYWMEQAFGKRWWPDILPSTESGF